MSLVLLLFGRVNILEGDGLECGSSFATVLSFLLWLFLIGITRLLFLKMQENNIMHLVIDQTQTCELTFA